jgi:hypothetical protein
MAITVFWHRSPADEYKLEKNDQKTNVEILRECEFHLESQCADPVGRPCNTQTTGFAASTAEIDSEEPAYRTSFHLIGGSLR